MRNLALIGFMGVGKSSVGRAVAHRLGFKFVDTDHLVESRAGKRIAEIFEQEGETRFRELEAGVVAELQDRSDLVIATGGGLPAWPGNLESLKTHALLVCLWASADKIWQRVHRHSHRPLLKTADPQGRIRELLAARTPFYRQADILLNTDNRSQNQVCEQVLQQFHLARAKRG
jgi:shikimate kinase